MRWDIRGVHRNYICNYIIYFNPDDLGTSKCNAKNEIYNRLIHLWTLVLCGKGKFGTWYRRLCLLSECPNCGVQNLRIVPMNWLQIWRLSENIVDTRWLEISKTIRTRRPLRWCMKGLPFFFSFKFLRFKLAKFIVHDFIAFKHDTTFNSVPEDTVIV